LEGKKMILNYNTQGHHASTPPPPNIPEPRPEMPPPQIPNPEPTPKPKGETISGDKLEAYKCKICGKTFDSKDELELHIKTDHKSRKNTERQ